MIETSTLQRPEEKRTRRKPRLGFVGVGWIGRARLDAVVRSGLAEAAGIFDPAAKNEPISSCPAAPWFTSFDELVEDDLDGIVIATPNALHDDYTITTLRA